MKKEYFSPELDLIKIMVAPVLGPSTYEPDPQDPTRDGVSVPPEGDL